MRGTTAGIKMRWFHFALGHFFGLLISAVPPPRFHPKPRPSRRRQISSQAYLHSGLVGHVTLLFALADLRSVFHLCFAVLTEDVVDFSSVQHHCAPCASASQQKPPSNCFPSSCCRSWRKPSPPSPFAPSRSNAKHPPPVSRKRRARLQICRRRGRSRYVSGRFAVVISWGPSSSVVHTSQYVHTHTRPHGPTQWTAVESNVLSGCRL